MVTLKIFFLQHFEQVDPLPFDLTFKFLIRSQMLIRMLFPILNESFFLSVLSRIYHFLCLSKFDQNVSMNGSFCIFHTWNLLSFSDVWINVIHHIWQVGGYYYLKYFFSILSFSSYLLFCYSHVSMLDGISDL